MIISWVVVGKGGLEEDIRRSWEGWGIPSPPCFSLHPAWDISTFVILAANSFLWWGRKKSIVFLKATWSTQKVHCFKMGWGGWVLWGERAELIPSFCLIMPDVIPVVMWVTTKPTASLCPWEQRLNCYAYKDTGLLFLSLLPLPHYCRHWLLLGIPTHLWKRCGETWGQKLPRRYQPFLPVGRQPLGWSCKTPGTSWDTSSQTVAFPFLLRQCTCHIQFPVQAHRNSPQSKPFCHLVQLSSQTGILDRREVEATRLLHTASKERHRPQSKTE